MTRAFIASATAHQPQRFVIAEGSADDAQASGEWIAAEDPAEVWP